MELTHRRRYPRIEANFPVQYTVERAENKTRALTLGAGGLFLVLREHAAPEAQLRVQFRPARHLPAIDSGVRVRYQLLGQGIGAEFTDIRPEHRQVILRFIINRMEEKRRYPRTAFAVQVDQEGDDAIGMTTDLSSGGMFLETNRPVQPGSTLKLRIHLGLGETPLEVKTEVLYTVLNLGMGVRFIDIAPSDRARIEAYVAKRK